MPEWSIEGSEKRFRRKNFYLPCGLADTLGGLTPDEKVELYKATSWADNITNREWEMILDGVASAAVRWRLRKKAVGWLMALARISVLAPDLYSDVWQAARELYDEQFDSPNPILISDEEREAR